MVDGRWAALGTSAELQRRLGDAYLLEARVDSLSEKEASAVAEQMFQAGVARSVAGGVTGDGGIVVPQSLLPEACRWLSRGDAGAGTWLAGEVRPGGLGEDIVVGMRHYVLAGGDDSESKMPEGGLERER